MVRSFNLSLVGSVPPKECCTLTSENMRHSCKIAGMRFSLKDDSIFENNRFASQNQYASQEYLGIQSVLTAIGIGDGWMPTEPGMFLGHFLVDRNPIRSFPKHLEQDVQRGQRIGLQITNLSDCTIHVAALVIVTFDADGLRHSRK